MADHGYSHYWDDLAYAHLGNSRKGGDISEFRKVMMIEKIVKHGLNAGLPKHDIINLLTLAQIESGFNPDAATKSRLSFASGLFGIEDNTAQDVIDRLNQQNDIAHYVFTDPPYNRFNPDSNTEYAIAIYLDKKRRAGSDNIESIYRQYNPDVTEQGLLKVKNTYNNFNTKLAGKDVANDEWVKNFWLLNFTPVIDSWHQKENDRINRAKRSLDHAKEATAPPPQKDPLVLDLNGDGIKTINVKDGTQSDHDGNGFAEQTGWADPNDGLLVMDRNGDGIINDGKELFGDQTILRNGTRATDGFQALAELDENADGKIDASDAAYGSLRVWRDEDGDGYSLPEELHTLDELGISSINVAAQATNVTDPQGNILNALGSFERADGTNGQIGNYSLQRDTLHTVATEWLEVPEDIAALPYLQGSGNVYDLDQAMVRDATGSLKCLVQQFVAATDVSARNSLMDQILFKWTGSDGLDPASRGGNFDGRKLAVLEKFLGRDFVSQYGANPIAQAVPFLNEAYRGLSGMYYGQLMSQTHLKDMYGEVTYDWDETSQQAKANLTAVIADLQGRLVENPEQGQVVLGEFARTIKGLGAREIVGFQSFRETFQAQSRELGWVIDSAGLPIIAVASAGPTACTANCEAIKLDENAPGTFHAGDGNDVLYGREQAATILCGDAGDDLIVGGSGNDTLYGWTGIDVLRAAQEMTPFLARMAMTPCEAVWGTIPRVAGMVGILCWLALASDCGYHRSSVIDPTPRP